MRTRMQAIVGNTTNSLFRLFVGFPMGYEVTGAIPINIEKAVIVCNHTSNLDPFFLKMAVNCFYPQFNMYGLAKIELFRSRIMRIWMNGMQTLPVNRKSSNQKDLQAQMFAILEEGGTIALFPQGTRNGTQIQIGAYIIASRKQVPILPVTIRYSRYGFFPRVLVRFSPLLNKAEYKDAEGLETILRDYWKL